MMNAIQQVTCLWEVWIEFDQSHPEHFGILYVHGEVAIEKKGCSSLTKMDTNGSSQLNLQLPARSSSLQQIREVVYSEPVTNPGQYTSVCIYSGGELIEYFNEIEILV